MQPFVASEGRARSKASMSFLVLTERGPDCSSSCCGAPESSSFA